jgi:thiaminase (transcriptional activator TenA)
MAGFSDYLRVQADPIWQAQHEHPFVRGLGDGTLDPATFGFWMRQDYLFLVDYARMLAAGVVRAPDLAAMMTFARLVHEILGREMELHRSYAEEFGITTADLEHATKAPVTQGYTDFLVRVSTTGSYPEMLGALLPCMWGYSEVATVLANRGLPADDRYRRWINVYADPEFAELAEWCRDATDRACAELSREHAAQVEGIFITSSRYELAFWEMAWRREGWGV